MLEFEGWGIGGLSMGSLEDVNLLEMEGALSFGRARPRDWPAWQAVRVTDSPDEHLYQ